MIYKNYTFPYGATFEVDPLIGVETEHGWIKQRLCNFTDLYIIVNSKGAESVIDIKYVLLYVDEEHLGNIVQYAEINLKNFIQCSGLPMSIYRSFIDKVESV